MKPQPPRPAPLETRLFLVASPGMEAAIAEEARRKLGDARVEPQPGGVELIGAGDDRTLIARANLLLRLPTRVLLRLGTIEARVFDRLRRGADSIPFAAFLPKGARVGLRASASRCRLFHTGAIIENLGLSLTAAVGATVGKPSEDEGDGFLILVRGVEDRFTLSLDTSGARLHQRGWRLSGGAAPLRETLAAAVLAIAELQEDEPVCDPMCGSGTIAIEAALSQLGRAPGLDRSFAFERFVDHDVSGWESVKSAARAAERPRALSIVAADADLDQLALARQNAERAGVAALIEFRHVPLAELVPPAATGLFVTNPPYGRRIGHKRAVPALYAEIGRALRGPFARWRAAVLVEDRALLKDLGVDQARARALDNGGLKVWIARREAKR